MAAPPVTGAGTQQRPQSQNPNGTANPYARPGTPYGNQNGVSSNGANVTNATNGMNSGAANGTNPYGSSANPYSSVSNPYSSGSIVSSEPKPSYGAEAQRASFAPASRQSEERSASAAGTPAQRTNPYARPIEPANGGTEAPSQAQTPSADSEAPRRRSTRMQRYHAAEEEDQNK